MLKPETVSVFFGVALKSRNVTDHWYELFTITAVLFGQCPKMAKKSCRKAQFLDFSKFLEILAKNLGVKAQDFWKLLLKERGKIARFYFQKWPKLVATGTLVFLGQSAYSNQFLAKNGVLFLFWLCQNENETQQAKPAFKVLGIFRQAIFRFFTHFDLKLSKQRPDSRN